MALTGIDRETRTSYGLAADRPSAALSRVGDRFIATDTGVRSTVTTDGTTQSWSASNGVISLDFTDASGTPGAATINKPRGRVAVAIGQSAVTVTNSLVTANSTVLAVITKADATFTTLLRVVPGAGSFTVTGNANATAATNVDFVVFN